MNPKWVLGVLCVVLALPGSAPADEKNVNIAVVDLTFIFENYGMTQALEDLFDRRRQAAAAEAESKRAAVEAKRKDLLARKPESKEFAQIEEEITRMQVEFEVWAALQEKRLKDDHKRWLMQIYTNVRNAVAEIATESNIDMVLTYDKLTDDAPDSVALRQQILLQKIIYFDDRIELTQAVLARLNEKYEKEGGATGLRLGMAPPLEKLPGVAAHKPLRIAEVERPRD